MRLAHADLSNTHFALEALYYSKKLLEDTGRPVDKEHDLNWGAAIKFIERCQNRPASNDQKWASDDPKNRGGFVYEPGSSKAGEDKLPDGRTAMRCYGSISYAGMLSFIYAGLTPDDPRVQAALQWLGENYTLDENPGMGAEGQFYYYHTMAKALSVAGIDELKTKDGKVVDWRDDLGRKLLNIQAGDGSWKNDRPAAGWRVIRCWSPPTRCWRWSICTGRCVNCRVFSGVSHGSHLTHGTYSAPASARVSSSPATRLP